MKTQNNKIFKAVSTLVTLGLGLMIGTVSVGSNRSYADNSEAAVSERLRESKPVAGRNRRRLRAPVSISSYPKANEDRVRVSRQLNKLRINVLSNDSGYKLRVVDVNRRSAEGARVSLHNGMAVYKVREYFMGSDSFWYTMEDKSGRQHSAKVIVCICEK